MKCGDVAEHPDGRVLLICNVESGDQMLALFDGRYLDTRNWIL